MKFSKLCGLLGAIALCLTLTAGPAEAGKTDWRDSHYDFSTVKAAWVEDIDLSGVSLESDILEKKLQEYYHEQETRPKWTVISKDQLYRKISLLEWKDMDKLAAAEPEKAKELWKKDLPKYVNVYVTAQLTRYEPSSYVVPAHTEWRTKEEKETYTDKDGKTQTITRTYEVPEYIPEYTVWLGNVNIRYDIHDAATGAVIFSREDVRSERDSLQNVYELSVRSFFRELKLK